MSLHQVNEDDDVEYTRDFLAARLLAALARLEDAKDDIVNLGQELVDPSDSFTRSDFEECLDSVVETLGLATRSIEAIQAVFKKVATSELNAGEPDFDDVEDDEE